MLILQFGIKWKLNLLLSTRDKIKQLVYKYVNVDLFAEDFSEIFTDKLLTIISSIQLKDDIAEIREFGLMWNEVEKINNVLERLNQEININIL